MSWSHDYWVDQAEIEAEAAGVPLGMPVASLPPIQRDKCWNCSNVPEPGKRTCRRCLIVQADRKRRRRQAIAQETAVVLKKEPERTAH